MEEGLNDDFQQNMNLNGFNNGGQRGGFHQQRPNNGPGGGGSGFNPRGDGFHQDDNMGRRGRPLNPRQSSQQYHNNTQQTPYLQQQQQQQQQNYGGGHGGGGGMSSRERGRGRGGGSGDGGYPDRQNSSFSSSRRNDFNDGHYDSNDHDNRRRRQQQSNNDQTDGFGGYGNNQDQSRSEQQPFSFRGRGQPNFGGQRGGGGEGFDRSQRFEGGGGRGGGGGGGGGWGRGDFSRNCYKCNQPGHFAADCSESKTFNNSDHKPPSTYEPAQKSADQLMEEHINSGVNFDKQQELEVTVKGQNVQAAFKTFDEAALSPEILENLRVLKYVKPSPIQKHAIPNILNQNDIMACAQTGSGKTAAFLLPIISTISETKDEEPGAGINRNAPHAIIVTPTRELAKQIVEDGKKYARHTDVTSVAVYGGLSMRHNVKQIENGCDILVGTMGRLMHFVKDGTIKLNNLKFFVLDEADRMISQGGFDREIGELCDRSDFPSCSERCTLMFSATFDREIQHLAQRYLQKDYVFISVGKVGAANKDIHQTVLEVKQHEKLGKLLEVLKADVESYEKDERGRYKKKTLVFVNKKVIADMIGGNLSQREWKSTTMHGDREQMQREEALDLLRSGDCAVLVATAVAARGLDVEGIDHVIVYDFPQTIDDYIHRIGRTARIGNTGRATVFYNDREDHLMRDGLIASLRDAEQIVPNWLDPSVNSGGSQNEAAAGAAKEYAFVDTNGGRGGNNGDDNDDEDDDNW